jgi:hypothetical protein
MIPTAALAALQGMVGDLVRVGGRVAAVDGDLLKLDDGTAQVAIRLAAGRDHIEPALRLGEVLNLTGVVRRSDHGGPEVVVRSMADIQRAASLRVTEAASPPPGGAFLSATTNQATDDHGSAPTGVPAPAALPLAGLAVLGAFVTVASLLLGMAGMRVWRRSRTAQRK